MRNTLLVYSSVDGHTLKISSKIVEHIKNEVNVDLIPISEAGSLSLKNYHQIIIGASIRYGKYRRDLFDFVESNLEDLSTKDNAFFSVNVVARKPEKNTPETNPYIEKFLKSTNSTTVSCSLPESSCAFPTTSNSFSGFSNGVTVILEAGLS